MPVVYPKNDENYPLPNLKPLLKTVYNGLDANKRNFNFEHPPSHSQSVDSFWDLDFDVIKQRLEEKYYTYPAEYDPISNEMHSKINKIKAELG